MTVEPAPRQTDRTLPHPTQWPAPISPGDGPPRPSDEIPHPGARTPPAAGQAGEGPLEPSDETLLARIAGQDLTALDRLYERHGRTAFSVAYGILGAADAAEDVTQDAFLTVWRRASTFDPRRGNARTWLLTVARHRAIDVARSRAARPRGVPLEDAGVLAAPDADPSAEALRRIEAVSVRKALDSLPGGQRQVVELAFFSGLSYPEIAERIGIPLGTVKSRIRLALERLRLVLMPEPAAL